MTRRNFQLLDARDQPTGSTYTGRAPRQAALKAAARGHEIIRLREHGTRKVHEYAGSRNRITTDNAATPWLKNTAWRGRVLKIGTSHIPKP